MKKAMIAGLAGALVLPAVAAADSSVDLWGEFRGSVAYTDEHALDSNPDDAADPARADDGELSWANNNSRIGINATLNDGPVQAFVWGEWSLSAGDEQGGSSFDDRQVYAGFKGNTWDVSYGKRQSAYAWAGEKVDPFYDTVAGTSSIDGSFGFSPLTDTFDGDQLAYNGNYMGLAVNGAVFFDDGSGEDDAGLAIGIGYDKGIVDLGLQILVAGDSSAIDELAAEATAYRFSAGINTKVADFGVNLEAVDPDMGDEAVWANVNAGFAIGDGELNVALGFANDETGEEGEGLAVGYFWNMMENTDLHALVSVVNPDDDNADEVVAVGLGVKHSFSAKIK